MTGHGSVMSLLAEYFRLCNDNAREFSHHYREQCDRLRLQVIRDGNPDIDGTYMVMKPKDDPIQTAMSRWTWWTNEAARIAREIRTERDLMAMGVEAMPDWYIHTLRECLTAARAANQALHIERRTREYRARPKWQDAHTVPLRTMRRGDDTPTVPMPRVQTDADERTEPRR